MGNNQSPATLRNSAHRSGNPASDVVDSSAVIRLGQPPDFKKVLPERVPGQRLRLTTNGAVLHNGGTISCRQQCPPPLAAPPTPDYDAHEACNDAPTNSVLRADRSPLHCAVERHSGFYNDRPVSDPALVQARVSHTTGAPKMSIGHQWHPSPSLPPRAMDRDDRDARWPTNVASHLEGSCQADTGRICLSNGGASRAQHRSDSHVASHKDMQYLDSLNPGEYHQRLRAVALHNTNGYPASDRHVEVTDHPGKPVDSGSQLFSQESKESNTSGNMRSDRSHWNPSSSYHSANEKSHIGGTQMEYRRADKSLDTDHGCDDRRKSQPPPPSMFYFGMNASRTTADAANTHNTRSPANTVATRSTAVVDDRLSHEASAGGGGVSRQVARIPSHTLNEFIQSLESSRRRQLSLNREDIVTNTFAPVECTLVDSKYDVAVDAGQESAISLELRPSVPRKHLSIPRFSPAAAWRDLGVDIRDEVSPMRGDMGLTGVALSGDKDSKSFSKLSSSLPINTSNLQKSSNATDSGIVLDSPVGCDDYLTHTQRHLAHSTPIVVRDPDCWVPAEDLESSKSGSSRNSELFYDHEAHERLGQSLPTLLSPAQVFGSRVWAASSTQPLSSDDDIINRSEVQCMASVIRAFGSARHQLDENWVLSRSMPSFALLDSDPPLQQSFNAEKKEFASPQSTGNHQKSPSCHAENDIRQSNVISEPSRVCSSKNQQEQGTVVNEASRPSVVERPMRRFTYQSTVRLQEKKIVEAEAARKAEEKERQRLEEQRALQQVEEEFQMKRMLMKSGVGPSKVRLNKVFEPSKEQGTLQQKAPSGIAPSFPRKMSVEDALDSGRHEASNLDSNRRRSTGERDIGRTVGGFTRGKLDAVPDRSEPRTSSVNSSVFHQPPTRPQPDTSAFRSQHVDARLHEPTSKGDHRLSGQPSPVVRTSHWLRAGHQRDHFHSRSTVRQAPPLARNVESESGHRHQHHRAHQKNRGHQCSTPVHSDCTSPARTHTGTSDCGGGGGGVYASHSPTSSASASTRQSSGYGSSEGLPHRQARDNIARPQHEDKEGVDRRRRARRLSPHREVASQNHQRKSDKLKNVKVGRERLGGNFASMTSLHQSDLVASCGGVAGGVAGGGVMLPPRCSLFAGRYKKRDHTPPLAAPPPPIFRHKHRLAQIPLAKQPQQQRHLAEVGGQFRRSVSQHDLHTRVARSPAVQVARQRGEHAGAMSSHLHRVASEQHLASLEAANVLPRLSHRTPSYMSVCGAVNCKPSIDTRYQRHLLPLAAPPISWQRCSQGQSARPRSQRFPY